MINPEIMAVVGFMKQVGEGTDVEILSEVMTVNADGDRGVELRIEDKETFLTFEEADRMLAYPNGIFRLTEFVAKVLSDDNPKTFLK